MIMQNRRQSDEKDIACCSQSRVFRFVPKSCGFSLLRGRAELSAGSSGAAFGCGE